RRPTASGSTAGSPPARPWPSASISSRPPTPPRSGPRGAGLPEPSLDRGVQSVEEGLHGFRSLEDARRVAGNGPRSHRRRRGRRWVVGAATLLEQPVGVTRRARPRAVTTRAWIDR